MLFHVFASQAERRSFGGSAFVEMQFCRLPTGTKTKVLVSGDNIEHWQNDSLYIDDENEFSRLYSHIFVGGVYNNLKSGPVDVYGINYYSPSLTQTIIDRLCEERPEGYEALLEWLEKTKEHNGFYILGI